jgi:hypothetical protein
MKTPLFRQPKTDAVEPDELDLSLPVTDSSGRPMHRECVLGGCSYRSRFLFNAGWVLAVTFLLVAAVTALFSARTNGVLLSTNEALMKENALLYQQTEAQRTELAAISARASAAPPAAPPVEKGPDTPVPPPKAALETRKAANESPRRPPPRPAPQSKPSTLNAVPESEKWWNRP